MPLPLDDPWTGEPGFLDVAVDATLQQRVEACRLGLNLFDVADFEADRDAVLVGAVTG